MSTDEGKALTYKWELLSKPEGSQLENPDNSGIQTVIPDKAGNYFFSLEVDNGMIKSEPSHVSVFAYENRPPKALTVKRSYRNDVNTYLIIDGGKSYDPDYEEIFYSWEVKSRPAGSLAEVIPDNMVSTTFTPDVAGRYEINLVVNDGSLSSDPYTTVVTALPISGVFAEPVTVNMLVYPNPASDYVSVELYLGNRTEAYLTLTNIEGHKVYHQKIIHPGSGLCTFNIDLVDMDIQGGVYFIHIRAEEFVSTRMIVIMR